MDNLNELAAYVVSGPTTVQRIEIFDTRRPFDSLGDEDHIVVRRHYDETDATIEWRGPVSEWKNALRKALT